MPSNAGARPETGSHTPLMRSPPMPPAGEVYALLDNSRDAGPAAGSLLFTGPADEVLCRDGHQLESALARLDRLRRRGLYLCGYASYEAGYFVADKPEFEFVARNSGAAAPLLHFFAFRERHDLTTDEVDRWLDRLPADDTPVAIDALSLNMDKQEYLDRIETLRDYIRAGETYQVNFTLKYRFRYQGSAVRLFRRLRDRQHVEYGALLRFPEFTVLSLSPELFLRRRGDRLESRPMKGTCPRGRDDREDASIVTAMRRDAKTRSENLMIVDLIRNDLGRIAAPGTVAVDGLFEIQTFDSLHQMISTVHCSIGHDRTFAEVFRQMFPCGSITGAPKLRTMQIIEALEVEPRGVYTGAVGYLGPDNDFCLNVPIRTCIAYPDGRAEMGVGGGILAESDPEAEYQECLLKARFLTGLNSGFSLLESMRFVASSAGIPRLSDHIARLGASARSLHFPFDERSVRQAIADASSGLGGDHKVRLLLHPDGRTEVTTQALAPGPERAARPRVDVAAARTRRRDLLLRHKTTERRVYEREYREHAERFGTYDVLFVNDAGRVTEASRHNLFVEKDGRLVTPPVSEGLLGGVERQALIDARGAGCEVRPLAADEVLSADRLLLTNAVRGVVEVELSEQGRAVLEGAAGR